MPAPEEMLPLPCLRQHTLLECLDHTSTVACHPPPRKNMRSSAGDKEAFGPLTPVRSPISASGGDGKCNLAGNCLQHQQFQHAVFTELSSMNERMEKLMALVHRSTEQRPPLRGIVAGSPTRKFGVRKSVTLGPSSVPSTPRVESNQGQETEGSDEKFRKARTKIRFLAIMAAAAKRMRRRVRIDNPRGDSDEAPKTEFSKTESSKPSLAGMAAHMGWDSEAAERMEQIQRRLHADKSSQTLRMKLWQLTESPFSSKLAFTYAWTSNVFVVFSFALSFTEGQSFSYVQVGFETMFAIEFLLRAACCPHPCTFLCSAFNWIDLLSIVPLGFRLRACPHKDWVLALVPVLRLFKPLRRFEKLRLMVDAFSIALEALPVLLYTLALVAIVFAEIFYFAEPRSNIDSLSYSLWFTIVTMFTVGYGDKTPTTTQGHVAASTLMMVSALYMAMPLGIVGDAFSRAWADRDRLLVIKRFRGAFLEGGFSLETFQHVFSVFDEDGSGSLDVDEFALMLKTIQMRMTEERINVLFSALDKEGAGHITLEALINLLAPKGIGTQIFEQGAEQAMNFLRKSSTVYNQEGDMAV